MPAVDHEPEMKLDVAVVFGEGPVLPVLLPEEATSDQKIEWDIFVSDPHRQKQPDFYLLTGNQYTNAYAEIREREGITPEVRNHLLTQKRFEWQHNSTFALRRIGRLNALAAGDALFTGKVEKVILSGGRTIPKWKRDEIKLQYIREFPDKAELDHDTLEKEVDTYLRYAVHWPSEAELMQDVIIREFGWDLFSAAYSQEQLHILFQDSFGEAVTAENQPAYKVFEHDLYQQFLEEKVLPRILLEDESMNTLDNIIFSMNKYPQELLGDGKRIGFFSSDWQRSRALLLSERFLLHVEEDAGISSQQYLKDRAKRRDNASFQRMMDMLMDEENPPIAAVRKDHDRLMLGLTKEEYANYWAGWMFKIQNPKVFVQVLKQFDNPKWKESMQKEFQRVGLNFDVLTEDNLLQLAEDDPFAYQQIIDRGVALTTPEHRVILPPLEKMKKS